MMRLLGRPKNKQKFRLHDPENEGITIFRNVGKYSSNDTASHPRRLESSAPPIWEPQISLSFYQSEKILDGISTLIMTEKYPDDQKK